MIKVYQIILSLFLVTTTARIIPNQKDGVPEMTFQKRQQFLIYTAEYGKSYSDTVEFQKRFEAWLETDIYLKQTSFDGMTMGHNKFSDWSLSEREKLLNPMLESQPSVQELIQQMFDEGEDEKLRGSTDCQHLHGCKRCSGDKCLECTSDRFILHRYEARCQCFTGSFNETTSDCEVCGEGMFYDVRDDQCYDCLDNCMKCKDKKTCMECYPNFSMASTKRACACRGAQNEKNCVFCTSQQYMLNGACYDCPENCGKCSTPFGICTECINDSFELVNGECGCPTEPTYINYEVVDGMCVALEYCGPGTYNNGENQCQDCPANCKTCNYGTGFCNQCNVPSMEVVAAMTDPEVEHNWNIHSNFYNTSVGACRCPPRHTWDEKTCIPLQNFGAGFYNDGLDNKIACAGNCTECLDFTGECVKCVNKNDWVLKPELNDCHCKPGYLLVDGVCERLKICLPGEYNDGQNNCLSCGDHCARCTMVDGMCFECEDSFHLYNEGQIGAYCSCNFTETERKQPQQYLELSNNTCIDLIECVEFEEWNDGKNNCTKCEVEHCLECEFETGNCLECEKPWEYDAELNECYCFGQPLTFLNETVHNETINEEFGLFNITYSYDCIELVSCGYRKYNPGNNSCPFCPTPNCAYCRNVTGECIECINDSFTLDTTEATCSCASDHYINLQSQCTKCPTNCTTCADYTGFCTSCDPSTKQIPRGGVCKCPSDTDFWSPTECVTKVNCGNGKYNDGQNNCLSCPSTCATCTWDNNCQTCKTNSFMQNATCVCQETEFWNGSNCVTLIDCPFAQYNDGENNCVACHTNFTDCYSQDKGKRCSRNYEHGYPNTDNCACGQYMYEDSNQFCQYGAVDFCGVYRDGDGACAVCKAYRELNGQGQCVCASDAYSFNGQCYPCPENCLSCINQYQCTSCKDTFTHNYPYSWQCNCLADQFKNGQDQCENCPLGCASCHNATHCTQCENTYQMNPANLCECGENTYVENGQCINYNSCPRGQYNNRIDNTCATCPVVDRCVQCGWVDDAVKCTKCDISFSLNITDGQYGSCGCLWNEYLTEENVCEQCSENTITCEDSTGDSLTCKPSYSLIGNQCICQENQFVNDTNKCQNCGDHCANCMADFYCLACEDTFTKVNIKGVGYFCECDLTKEYLNTDNNTCVFIYDPPPGHWNDGKNLMTPCYDSHCDTCTDSEPESCSKCQPNFELLDDFSCYCADEDYFLDEWTDQCIKRIDCGPQKYNNGTNGCFDCPLNCTSCTYDPVTTNVTCDECENNLERYLIQKVPKTEVHRCKCPTNLWRNETGDCTEIFTVNCARADDVTGECTNCVTGFTLTDDLMCRCNATQYYDSLENKCENCPTQCTSCRRPRKCDGCVNNFIFYRDRACICEEPLVDSGTECLELAPCEPGHYKPNPKNNVCLPCDYGCLQCNDEIPICTQCDSGFTLYSGSCSARRLLDERTSSKCADGCQECQSETKKCVKCWDGYYIHPQDDSKCLPCDYWPVGPVESPTQCLETKFNSERVVPTFKAGQERIDWRDWGVVRPVEDHINSCGAISYAESTVAAAESAYAIKTGYLYELSEEFLVECDYKSRGCSGGHQTSSALLLANQGAVSKFEEKTQCEIEDPLFYLVYPGLEQVQNSLYLFKQALLQQPLLVTFRVSPLSFFQYQRGIMPESACDATQDLNYSLVAIGYGYYENRLFVTLQNSFGEDWGEAGYLRVELSQNDKCGILEQSFKVLV